MAFFAGVIKEVAQTYSNGLQGRGVNPAEFADRHYLAIAYLDDRPVGLIAGVIGPNILDKERIILKQVLLYVRPGSLCAYALLKEFIDFGRQTVDDIFTVIGAKTRIKPRTLERLGFSYCESIYRMEVK